MKTPKATIFASLFILIMLMTLSGTTQGITGNYVPDSTPYVGVVVLFGDIARTQLIGYCTGFLVSPDVVLTAGHACMQAAAVSVCFDKGPISYEIGEDGTLVYYGVSEIYNGIAIPYPEYLWGVLTGKTQGKHILEYSDVGVIILDEDVTGISEYASLPGENFADSLPAKTYLRIVGYGMQFQVTPKHGGGTDSWVGYVACNTAMVQLKPGNFAGSERYLRCSANPSQGRGGVAFGDSGGPVLYDTGNGEVVVAINSYVNNDNCAGVSYHCRIDTPGVLDWINEMITNPPSTS